MNTLPQEIVSYIFNFVNDGKTYKSVLETCKSYNKLCFDSKKKNKFCNQLLTLLMKFHGKDWNWLGISRNHKLTMEFVDAHPDKDWDWHNVSCNPNITMEIIKSHPNKPWDWKGISFNPNLTIDYVEANSDKEWDWKNRISRNKFK